MGNNLIKIIALTFFFGLGNISCQREKSEVESTNKYSAIYTNTNFTNSTNTIRADRERILRARTYAEELNKNQATQHYKK